MTRALVRGRQQVRGGERCNNTSKRLGDKKFLEAKRCGYPAEARKGKGFPARDPRRNQSCRRLGFGLVRPVWGFWSPELYESNLVW